MSISFIRVDDRMIHGQTCTRWALEYPCDGLIAVNDKAVTTPVLKAAYKNASDKKTFVWTLDEWRAKCGKVLASKDIDGTLLDSAHRLPPANREAVQFAAKNGAAICLMSARPPRAVFPIRDALGVDGPLACCGGGLILAGEKRLADSRLTRECTRAVLHETQARHIHLSVYRDLEWLIAAEDEWSRAEAAITGIQPTIAPLETLFSSGNAEAGAHKLLCMGEKHKIDELLPVLEAKHLPMTLVRSKDEYLEVVPAGAGKDTAMRALCEALGLTPAEVIALGDHDIDAPLLRAAGLGIAMGNASAEARAAADEVTASCDEDGVAHAIYRHIEEVQA